MHLIQKLSLLGVVMLIGLLGAQSQDMSQPIPFDPDTRTGTLENGMKYYVRYNAKPENNAELRLALNAGSILETEEQQGLAHFLEHMCFNGTENFPKNDLVNYLESIGVRFGAHLNAYTSFDETVYMLRVPTDNEEQFQQGFQIMEDWMHQLLLEPEEIDKERGVVIEEWRTRLGAQQRIAEQAYDKIFYGSRYPNRIPIGDTAVLKHFEYETLRAFYEDWYRPNLMAIVVVGDIDVDQVEDMIKRQFSGVENPENAPERVEYGMPDHEETLVSLIEDEEATFNRVEVFWKHPTQPTESLADFRRDLITSLASTMLSDRLSELAQEENPPFTFSGAGYSSLVRPKEVYNTTAVVPNGGYLKGFEAIWTENQRARQHGFTSSELNRAKSTLLARLDQQYAEREKTPSARVVNRYVYHFLNGSPAPSIGQRRELSQALLPTISLAEVNSAFAAFITDKNRVISISGAEREDNPLPSEEEVLAVIRKVDAMDLEPYAEEEIQASLLEEMPEAGEVVSRSEDEELGTITLELSNGATVVLRPTDFQNDQILFRSFSKGGHSQYADEVYKSASMADNMVSSMGIGPFGPVDLEKFMSDKVVSLSPSISEREEGMNGRSSVKDFETLLQMVYLYHTDTPEDQAAFNSMVSRMSNLYANLGSNPQYWFQDQVTKAMYNDHPRRQALPDPADFEQIDLETVVRVFGERFGGADDFTYLFVGSFTPEEIIPMITQYIGAIPKGETGEEPQDVGARILTEATAETFYRGKEDQAQVVLRFITPGDWSLEDRYELRSATEVLSIMLREALREDEGGVYGVRVNSAASRGEQEYYQVSIQFTCAPSNVEKLIGVVEEIVSQLVADGPSAENLQKVRETQLKEYEEAIKTNSFWLGNLAFGYRNEVDLDWFLDMPEDMKGLSAENIQAAAAAYMKSEHFVQMVLMPEKE